MNNEYKEVTESVEIPPHAGVEGFLLALRNVLKQPRVVRGEFDARGRITYTRYARQDEPRRSIEVNFDTVSPANLVRNAEVVEVDISLAENAAVCMAVLFQAAAADHLFPIAWVAGADTVFYDWHQRSTGVAITGNAYGLPMHKDRFIPDDVLLLSAAFAREGGLIDVQRSYKISMPSREVPMRVEAPVRQQSSTPSSENLVVADVPSESDMMEPS